MVFAEAVSSATSNEGDRINLRVDEAVKVGDERVRVRANKGKEGEGRIGSTVALTVLFGPLGLLKRSRTWRLR